MLNIFIKPMSLLLLSLIISACGGSEEVVDTINEQFSETVEIDSEATENAVLDMAFSTTAKDDFLLEGVSKNVDETLNQSLTETAVLDSEAVENVVPDLAISLTPQYFSFSGGETEVKANIVSERLDNRLNETVEVESESVKEMVPDIESVLVAEEATLFEDISESIDGKLSGTAVVDSESVKEVLPNIESSLVTEENTLFEDISEKEANVVSEKTDKQPSEIAEIESESVKEEVPDMEPLLVVEEITLFENFDEQPSETVESEPIQEVILDMDNLVAAEDFSFTSKNPIEVSLELNDYQELRAYVSLYSKYQQLDSGRYYPDSTSQVIAGTLHNGTFTQSFVGLNNQQEYLIEVWFYDGSEPLQKELLLNDNRLLW